MVLRGFWDFSEEELYPLEGEEGVEEEIQKCVEFLNKRDWEGGTEGLMNYGGSGIFPEAVKVEALIYENAKEELERAIDNWANDLGVAT